MNEQEITLLIARLLRAQDDENNERFMEIKSALSAQRFLLEQAYANAFLGNPDAFADFMAGALEKTRSKSTAAGPMSKDARIEATARIATHLARFGESVSLRLREGRQEP